jgi:SWI/SNF-related matrix-associated actin-dependent regulator of chromatin subfamily D
MQAQQQQALIASDRAKLRSRKPTDKNIPDGVEDCIIGDGVQRYRDLREVERRLDATMVRKRLDIQDAVNRNVKVSPCNWSTMNCAELFVALSNTPSMD